MKGNIMAGTASGVTTFVLGREADGNRETRTFTNGQQYDLDFSLVKAYSADETEFPIIA
jgi:hypothetical protein